MRRRRQAIKFDPVKDWDGLVTAPNHMLITPEQMEWNARRNMAAMEQIPRIAKEDAEALATPIGGVQFKLKS